MTHGQVNNLRGPDSLTFVNLDFLTKQRTGKLVHREEHNIRKVPFIASQCDMSSCSGRVCLDGVAGALHPTFETKIDEKDCISEGAHRDFAFSSRCQQFVNQL